MHLSWEKSQSMKFFFLHLEAITLFAALDIAVQKFVMSFYTDLYIPILSLFCSFDMGCTIARMASRANFAPSSGFVVYELTAEPVMTKLGSKKK